MSNIRSRPPRQQRSTSRWAELRRLRRGLVGVRRHSLHSSAYRTDSEAPHAMHQPGMGLIGRVTRVALPLVLLSMSMVMGRRYVVQQFDVETALRRQLIPQLERQYHTKIEAGEITTDWRSRVVIRDVVIGRDVASPLGALARARRITLSLNFVQLVARRAPLDCLTAVSLDEPQLFLRRDGAGRINLLELFKGPSRPGARWTGTVQFHGGRLWLEDGKTRSASGETLLADGRGLEGLVRFNGERPVQFDAALQRAFIGKQRLMAGRTTLHGAAAMNAQWVTAETVLPELPAALMAGFASPKKEVTATRGALHGTLRFAWDKERAAAQRLTASGELELKNVSATQRFFLEPGAAGPMPVALSGPIRFANKTWETPGLTATALGSTWRVAGMVAAPGCDLQIQSDTADMARLLRLARAKINNRWLSEPALATGPARCNLRLVGAPGSWKFSGPVTLPTVRIQHPRFGSLRAAALTADVVGSAGAEGLRLDLTAALTDAALKNSPWGDAAGKSVHAKIGWDGARLATDFRLAGLTALSQKTTLHATALGGTAHWQGDRFAVVWQGKGVDVKDEKQHAARALSLDGTLNWNGKWPPTRAALKMTAAGVSGAWPGLGKGSLDAMKVVGDFSRQGQQTNARFAASLRGVNGSSAKFGALRGRNLRLDSALGADEKWDGIASLDTVDLSGLRLAAWPAAQGVRRLGMLDGELRFADASRDELPRIFGPVRLSRVETRDITVSDVSGRVAWDGKAWRLDTVVAQSDLGALRGNVRAGGAGGLSFALLAPGFTLQAAQINPFLRPYGLQAGGTATGSLNVTAGAPGSYVTRFDLTLPDASLKDARGVIHLKNAHWRGNGTVKFSEGGWRGSGDMVLAARAIDCDVVKDEAAAKTGPLAIPVWLGGARGAALRVALRGAVESDGKVISPHLSGSVETATASLPLPNEKSLEVREARAEFIAEGNAFQAPRLTLFLGDSEFNGHVGWDENGALRGQLLADSLDVAQLQELALPGAAWTVRGTGFAQADLGGTRAAPTASVKARLYNGALRWEGGALPLDAARGTVQLAWPLPPRIAIENCALWSKGARAEISGAILRQETSTGLELTAKIQDFRAARLADFPQFKDAQQEAGLDGLVDSTLKISGSAARPRLQGTANVRLAQAFGIALNEASGEVDVQTTADGPRIAVTKVSGRADGTPFAGSFSADLPAGTWSAQLKADELAPANLLRAADGAAALARKGIDDQGRFLLGNLPLRGALAADVQVSGTLRNALGASAPRAQAGHVKLSAADLRWRGLPLGHLQVDLALVGGVLKTRTLELMRPPAAVGGKPALWQVSGDLPTALDDKNLNATLRLKDEKLAYFLDAIQETQRALKRRQQSPAWLDQITAAIAKLPPSLDGAVKFDAALGGQWSRPRIAVKELAVQGTHARGPLGTELALPSVQAAFAYDGTAITIQNAALRLEADRQPVIPGETTERDDTVLRISEGGRLVPGGAVNLEARLINANLAQIAPWVPALRDAEGASLLRGDLRQFAFSLTGPADNPRVIGSISAEMVSYGGKVNFDSLRIARFDVADDFLTVAAPNLTITKGSFQSSAASGKIGWKWKEPGLRPDTPVEVHMRLQRSDLGALSSTFLPALAQAEAENFSGSVDVSGTIGDPHFAGEIDISQGRFRLTPALLPLDTGLTGVTGQLRFADGNRVVVSGPGGVGSLRGKIAPPESVKPTKNGPPPKTTTESAHVSGDFALGGEVRLLEAAPKNSSAAEALARPLESLDWHRYNVALEVSGAQVSTATISGLRNVNAAVLWKTTGNKNEERQLVRWMMSANGTAPTRKGKADGGRAFTLGGVELRPEFATSFQKLIVSRVTPFTAPDDFKSFAAFGPVQAAAALLGPLDGNQPARIVLDGLQAGLKNTVTGRLDGVLQLDNRPATPRLAPRIVQKTITSRLASRRDMNATPQDMARLVRAADVDPDDEQRPEKPPFIRVAGKVTLSEAVISSAPAGGVSAGAVLPDGPLIDVTLVIGRDTQFIAQNVSADVTGEIQIGGTPRDPEIAGTVLIPSGQMRFPSTQARITKGELNLTGLRDPATNLLRTSVFIKATASGQVGRYKITMDVSGPLDLGSETTQNLKIDITSNPPVTRDQAFTLLLGIRAPRSDQTGFQDENYGDALVQIFTSPFFSGIEKTLQRTFGLDTVALEYRLSEPVRVQIGKAIGKNFYVSYRRVLGNISGSSSLGFNSERKYTLRIEYRLKNGWLLSREQNELDNRLSLERAWRF